MKTPRENVLSLLHRQGYEKMPVNYDMCPSLSEKFNEYVQTHDIDFEIHSPFHNLPDLSPKPLDPHVFDKYYEGIDFKPGTVIDMHGIAHEPGSAAAFHMTKMYHPMEHFDSVEQIQAYEFRDYRGADRSAQQASAAEGLKNGRCLLGGMQCTIWETAWYLRGMENLMMDMMSDDPMAEVLLDRVTENSVLCAEAYARAGADCIFLGDDIGMQHTIMMSKSLYADWLKPRLQKVIRAARAIKPDVLILYHSCGHVTEFIPDLIEVGVDVLNPVQPECMDFRSIHAEYGDQLSFLGTIGTQTTMPFGTPDEVRRKVFENLDIAGDPGGLFVCPTHLLEPEVPVENVVAYLKACRDYK